MRLVRPAASVPCIYIFQKLTEGQAAVIPLKLQAESALKATAIPFARMFDAHYEAEKGMLQEALASKRLPEPSI
jgi:hypothetical protein